MILHVIDYACGGNMWLTILSYLMIRTQTRILHQINPYKIQKNKDKICASVTVLTLCVLPLLIVMHCLQNSPCEPQWLATRSSKSIHHIIYIVHLTGRCRWFGVKANWDTTTICYDWTPISFPYFTFFLVTCHVIIMWWLLWLLSKWLIVLVTLLFCDPLSR